MSALSTSRFYFNQIFFLRLGVSASSRRAPDETFSGPDSTRAKELYSPPWVRFRKMLCCDSLPTTTKGAGTSLLVRVYKALLEPVLMYCIALRGSSYDNVIRYAQMLQNDVLRVIVRRRRDEPVSKSFSKYKLPKSVTSSPTVWVSWFQDRQ